jgi:hypothetical protein
LNLDYIPKPKSVNFIDGRGDYRFPRCDIFENLQGGRGPEVGIVRARIDSYVGSKEIVVDFAFGNPASPNAIVPNSPASPT